MNELRKMYERAPRKEPFMELDPLDSVHKAAIDSFLKEHFSDHLNKPLRNTAIYANLYETPDSLDLGILIRYLNEESVEKALYAQLTAADDPLLAAELTKRNCDLETHTYASGTDELATLESLRKGLGIEEKSVKKPVKHIPYGQIQNIKTGYAVELEVLNKHGLHARPAASVVEIAQTCNGDITMYKIVTGSYASYANAKSIMEVLMQAAAKGTKLRFEANGRNGKEILESLVELFDRKFDEE